MAYAFLSLMANKPVGLWNAQNGWTGVDPGYTHQFLKPEGSARLVDYVKAGRDRRDVTDYLQAYYETFTAETMLPYLRIRGTHEYWNDSLGPRSGFDSASMISFAVGMGKQSLQTGLKIH